MLSIFVYGSVLGFDYRYAIRATSAKEQGVKVQILHLICGTYSIFHCQIWFKV